ncbi:hypothetical protein SPHINGO8BC_150676 [Sphingobacterium multivorum]|uniref:Uncharacterized protein n=1 Tax=Sphingobacterium multivorum TaxID=28454 RepID=A0A654AYL3_SPHMU|nr:hypothetical protein SPHINGO8BC_150676 [Sphingobacterium multivorum]
MGAEQRRGMSQFNDGAEQPLLSYLPWFKATHKLSLFISDTP